MESTTGTHTLIIQIGMTITGRDIILFGCPMAIPSTAIKNFPRYGMVGELPIFQMIKNIRTTLRNGGVRVRSSIPLGTLRIGVTGGKIGLGQIGARLRIAKPSWDQTIIILLAIIGQNGPSPSRIVINGQNTNILRMDRRGSPIPGAIIK